MPYFMNDTPPKGNRDVIISYAYEHRMLNMIFKIKYSLSLMRYAQISPFGLVFFVVF